MKTNYLPDKNSFFGSNYQTPKRNKFKVFVFVLLLLFLLIIGYRSISGILITFLSPALSFDQSNILSPISILKGTTALEDENRQLKDELQTARLKILSLEDDRRSLYLLGAELGRQPETWSPMIPAFVIKSAHYLPYDLMLVDAGRSRTPAVSLGQLAALSDDQVVLGEVVQILKQAAKIKLYSSPQTEIPVIVGPDRIIGQAIGRGGGNFSIILPKGVAVKIGDQVRTIINKKEYLLAVVGRIVDSQDDPFQIIYAVLPVNIYQLDLIGLYDR